VLTFPPPTTYLTITVGCLSFGSRISAVLFSFRGSLVVYVGAALVTHAMVKRTKPSSITVVLILLVIVPTILSFLVTPFIGVSRGITLTLLTFYASLSTSIVLHRLSPFHPLSQYPGPIPCKISKIWMMLKAGTGKQHLYIQSLHQRYGDIVRIGPNEVSISDPSAITPLMGTTGWSKGPNWEGRTLHPLIPSLIIMRDPALHARRRKPWNRAFNTTALKDYEPIIAARASEFVDGLLEQKGTVNLARWICYFTFGFMSDMAFVSKVLSIWTYR